MTSDSIIKSTDYCGNLIYEQGRPKMLLVDGGFVTFDGNNSNSNSSPTGGGLEGASYHYYLKDHLGNNRVVVGENDSIEQVNHYYPYGGLMAESTGGDTQRYKYNGKELDRMHGLDWYDYGARWMSGLTFTTPDPKAWDYTDVSPYVYCHNNPISRIDPDGRDDEDKVVGYIVGTITNIIPFSGFLRDSYTPNDIEDYNNALQTTDNIASSIGQGMITAGGTAAAAGGAMMGAGVTATVTSGGVASPVSVSTAAAGSALIQAGTIVGIAGAVMNANSKNNKIAGYDRGKKSNVSSGNKNSQHANQKRKSVAEDRYVLAKKIYENLRHKAVKTHEDKILERKAQKAIKHIKKQRDYKGENHSRNAKGNRR